MSERSEFGVTIPFVEQLGIRLVELSRERAIVALKRRPELLKLGPVVTLNPLI